MTKRRTEILHITQTQRSERQTGTVKGTDILSDTHAHMAWSYTLQTAHKHTMGPTFYRQNTDRQRQETVRQSNRFLSHLDRSGSDPADRWPKLEQRSASWYFVVSVKNKNIGLENNRSSAYD